MVTATLHPQATQRRSTGEQPGTRTRRPALVPGEGGDAIAMPAAFAELVQAELGIMMLAGPVVASPKEGSWTFLTQPANTRSPVVPADLLPLGIRLIPAGTQITLPPNADRSWIAPPLPNRPPAIWSCVIGAARRVAARLVAG
ncbi:MAG TPA: hypothetical protein VGR06_21925 [Actinophytocola sp.]|jgi:hypothetical protein|uniref:hypothetical protein n=1 Tax=Actinophytocola sp. TaxID=1872138 RepID=UPI002E052A18|nr:hypothetical protein [Actinophytocola sp.]